VHGGDARLPADYFDGRSARAQPARVQHERGQLVISFDGGERRVPLAQVQWPERQRHGARIAHFAAASGGGSLQCDDSAAWDAFVRGLPASSARDGLVVRAQQSWRGVLAAVLLLVVLLAAGYLWGVPLAARGVVAALPLEADATVGRVALQSVEGRWLKPSQLPAEHKARLAAAFARMVAAAYPDVATRPAYDLRFHASTIGPNAFALPGGTIVLTDELVALLPGRDDAVLGVLAHELGHVRARHGMRLVVQVSLLGAATSAALGDFSSVLAGVPALLGQMAYSRDAEREADAESVRMMKAAGLSPLAMVEFFERARAWRESEEGRRKGAGFDIGIAFSSHPADAERIAFFRDAAVR
jgi:Zn-dependent protease with chaperone function